MSLRFKFNMMFIPPNLRFKNCRSEFSTVSWDIVRKKVYEIDNNICQCCGADTKKRLDIDINNKLEAHEQFELDEKNNKFVLVDIVSLCSICHAGVHIKRNNAAQIHKIKKYLKDNKAITYKGFNKEVLKLKNTFRKNYDRRFKLDLMFLEYFAKEHNIKLHKKDADIKNKKGVFFTF